jgi:phosphatidylserine/phosphatidylglycerophosphate/cardiolipin synthase-like enzyme
MKPDEIEAELLKTLEDQRLSRSEKRALGELVREMDPDQRAMLRNLAFKIAKSELDDDKRTRNVLSWLEEVVKTASNLAADDGPPSRAYFSPGQDPLRTIVGLLGAARETVDICVFTITDDRIAEAIIATKMRGVTIRIVSDDDKAFDRGSDIDKLRAAGIQVRTDRSEAHMHHKFAVFDRQTLLTGSYNWTRSAASDNYENVIVTADIRLTQSFSEAFEHMWDHLG